MSELVKNDNQLSSPSNGLVSQIERIACNPDADINKLEKLWEMQQQALDRGSKNEYYISMSECQGEMPTVVKDAVNEQTSSSYAKFESIIMKAKPCYTKHGFSLSFGTSKSDVKDHIRVTCSVMHKKGHKEDFFVDLPLDIAGIKGSVNKTVMHATASTFSYGERYLFCMIFNIAVADHDNDGVRPGDVTVEKLLEYNAAVRDLFESIYSIKSSLSNDDYDTAYESWIELTDEEKTAIWKAPSKGGIFTTKERAKLKSDEFSEARNKFSEANNG